MLFCRWHYYVCLIVWRLTCVDVVDVNLVCFIVLHKKVVYTKLGVYVVLLEFNLVYGCFLSFIVIEMLLF